MTSDETAREQAEAAEESSAAAAGCGCGGKGAGKGCGGGRGKGHGHGKGQAHGKDQAQGKGHGQASAQGNLPNPEVGQPDLKPIPEPADTEASAGCCQQEDSAGCCQQEDSAGCCQPPADDVLALALADVGRLQEEVTGLQAEVARGKADYYNLQQEYGAYVRRTKAEAPAVRAMGQAEVVEALISVLDDIEAARAHGDLVDGPFAAIAAKLESTLETRFEMERYGEAGEPFDPEFHEALMAQDNPDVEVATISQVLQPGYRLGEKILRPTKVLVDNPA